MNSYLIVETRSPYQSIHSLTGIQLAIEISEQMLNVDLWFMQDAIECFQLSNVELTQKLGHSTYLSCFVEHNGYQRRGGAQLPSFVEVSSMDLFTNQLMAKNTKVIWH